MLIKYFHVLFLFGPLTAFSQVADRPNIIFILTDDQRWDALGYAGNEIIQTPHMDEMAREGIYFENSFVTTPICAASRASIITGIYERTHDFTFRTPPLAQQYLRISYPYLLKEAGYRTGFFGKLGMQFENQEERTFFDEHYYAKTDGYFRLQGEGWSQHVHLTDLTTDKAIEFIEASPRDQPFCLSISYNAPHADDSSPQQYFWPSRNDDLYEKVVIPPPTLGAEEYFISLPDFLRDSLTLGRIRWHWRYATPEMYQRMVKGYYRMISTVDDNLGRIRKHLEDANLADNTIIILMGDNGYFLGERSLAGKWLMYENSLRVPLILFDPHNAAPKRIQKMALNIDIAPTILDYAGVKVPKPMQGRSLRSLATDEVEVWRDYFVCEHLYELPYIPKSEGLRTEEWKYFRYLDYPEVEEFYDLTTDSLEVNNLIDDPNYLDLVDFARKKLHKEIQQLDADPFK